jgi:hypothetical protein
MIWRNSIFGREFGSGSEGTIENSQAFQCRDRLELTSSPGGTAENLCRTTGMSAVPAGLIRASGLIPGIEMPGYFQNVPVEGVTN